MQNILMHTVNDSFTKESIPFECLYYGFMKSIVTNEMQRT